MPVPAEDRATVPHRIEVLQVPIVLPHTVVHHRVRAAMAPHIPAIVEVRMEALIAIQAIQRTADGA